jgi:ParB-like chromosome segregation protein Spo0J
MRKQYYFRPSINGFYAWDVDRLVELSQGLPVIDVELNKINDLDEQFKGKFPTYRSIAEHMKLVEETDLKYPIILSKDGLVMDGMHRVIKALLLGHKTIKAVQFKEDLKPDYVDVQNEDLPYD